MLLSFARSVFFFFNDTATTEIYTLSLHDALPISSRASTGSPSTSTPSRPSARSPSTSTPSGSTCRSEEHTSELQSLAYLVCRLLLEKKKKKLEALIVTTLTSLRTDDTPQSYSRAY